MTPRSLFRHLALGLALSAAGLMATVPAQAASVLRFVPQADLKVVDPVFTTNYVTRNFSYLVYDTLFALDAKGVPQPQMVGSHTVSKDGKRWTFTLRDGLAFHDGSPVTAADCVASLKRWADKDSYGRAMKAAGGNWQAIDARTFTLTLAQPFGLVLEALAKVSSLTPFIMPARLAEAAGNGAITEVMGSGPYRFNREQWSPGNRVVFEKNPTYIGRSEAPSFLAGNKTAHIDRIEWVILPDANSATAALRNGEVDMLELVPPDNIASLRSERGVRIGSAGAYQASLILNHLHPPFDKPQARQALLLAIDQERVLAGMGYPLDMRMKHCATMFVCGGVNDTDAGAAPYRTANLDLAKQRLAESGYQGEKVVMLVPTDYSTLNGAAMVTVQAMKKLGMNVEMQSMDWASIVSRRVKKESPAQGGWSLYATFAVESSIDSPLSNFMLGAACGNSMPGWPCDATLDGLRLVWLQETDPIKRKDLLARFQARAFEVVPYAPVGQYSGAYAVRTEVKHSDAITSDVPTLWVLDK